MQDEKLVDRLAGPTPGKIPLFDEPLLDAAADIMARKLKEKKPAALSANDKFILNLVNDLAPGELLIKGYIQHTIPIIADMPAVFRTLVIKQIEAISYDVSHFQQQKETSKDSEGAEQEVWRPTLEQVKIYHMKRTLCETVISLGEFNIPKGIEARMEFFSNLETMFFNAVYRKMQQFFTAVSLIFPSDNQKELLESLKKSLESHP